MLAIAPYKWSGSIGATRILTMIFVSGTRACVFLVDAVKVSVVVMGGVVLCDSGYV